MSKVVLTPIVHDVHNEFDKFGLLLGLLRLINERNWKYKQRLLDVLIHRANSTQMGLIYGITRELGLSITKALTVECILDENGDPLCPVPAVKFTDTRCILYSDYSKKIILKEIDRMTPEYDSCTLGELVYYINETGYYNAELLGNVDPNLKALGIFKQSSVERVPAEDIGIGTHNIKLLNSNLIPETVAVRSANLVREVDSELELKQKGDYFIDFKYGYLRTTTVPSTGSAIRYEFFHDKKIFLHSPVIIQDLQDPAFRSKLFHETEADIYGLPTLYGADIINELLSLYPTSWGK